MRAFLIMFALVVAMAAVLFIGPDVRSFRPNDQRAASGDCKAIRKQAGRTQWECSNGDTFWLESYRHEEKQSDWKPPKDCTPARPQNVPGIINRTKYTDKDAKRYRQCADGQSFWVR